MNCCAAPGRSKDPRNATRPQRAACRGLPRPAAASTARSMQRGASWTSCGAAYGCVAVSLPNPSAFAAQELGRGPDSSPPGSCRCHLTRGPAQSYLHRLQAELRAGIENERTKGALARPERPLLGPVSLARSVGPAPPTRRGIVTCDTLCTTVEAYEEEGRVVLQRKPPQLRPTTARGRLVRIASPAGSAPQRQGV